MFDLAPRQIPRRENMKGISSRYPWASTSNTLLLRDGRETKKQSFLHSGTSERTETNKAVASGSRILIGLLDRAIQTESFFGYWVRW
jgi:hypothetical protein